MDPPRRGPHAGALRAPALKGGDPWTKLHFGGDFLDYQIFSLTEINFGTCYFFAAGGNEKGWLSVQNQMSVESSKGNVLYCWLNISAAAVTS